MDFSDALDSKASGVIGFIGIIVGAIFGFTFFFQNMPDVGVFSLKISTFFLILAFILNLLSLKNRMYLFDPNPKALVENYENENYEKTIIQITHNIADSYEKNKIKLKKKARYINISLGLMLISIVVLSIGIFMG